MEIELVEIRDFLAQRPPFDSLSEQRLNELPDALQIRYLRRNSAFPPPDIQDNFLYVIRSGAIALLDAQNKLLEKLGEGDYYTTDCQLVDFENVDHAVAEEDSLLYLLPCDLLKKLRKESTDFAQHFNQSMRERMQHAVARTQDHNSYRMSYLTVEIGELLNKPPVTVDVTNSIQQTAQIMSEHKVSSAMLMDGTRLAGIVTDRDLRKRCISAGISTDQPVKNIMTSEPVTVQSNTIVMNALMTMTRLSIHHLPVLRDEEVIGMLTATDMARLQSTNSAFIAADIRKAQSLDELVTALAQLPGLQLQLANSSATALHIGEVISCITDYLTTRLIELAQDKLGPAPVPFVWVCGGSQARMEQSAHSDQDNALIISDEMQPEHDSYFAALAKMVTHGLDACGYIYCPGDAMASTKQWRQPLHIWQQHFHKWIHTPEPKALMLASIFFDLRPVFGDFSLYNKLHKKVLKTSKENQIFIAYMAGNALTHRPPLGFFRTFVLVHDGEHDDTLDIKHRGIVPITDIARVLALSEGLSETNTTERLRAAAKTSALSREMAANLQDALEFIASLRINHQAEQIRGKLPPDNYLPPEDLSELERKHLRDAFKIIEEMQNVLDHRYQLARFR